MQHQIRLSKGLYALVSEIDFEYLSQFSWCASYDSRCKYYAKRRCKKASKKFIRMHREIFERISGEAIPAGLVVDHINGNSLDNRRENLRLLTARENLRHQYARRKTT